MAEQITWDQRYSSSDFMFGTEPNRYLQSQAWQLRPGMTALSVADGEGRNGVWLAQQGLDVLSIDLSAVGLAKAAQLALQRGVPLKTEQCNLLTWDWPVAAFDVIASIFVHLPTTQREIVHGKMASALKPGGLLILESYNPCQLTRSSGGPSNIDMLSTPQTLQHEFATLTTIELLEGIALLDEGPLHSGISEVVRLLARKP
jgi:2-polyprenyl-3-methyl-5-hydroxy-6-metoxy-1,4-benzoquinol methylase